MLTIFFEAGVWSLCAGGKARLLKIFEDVSALTGETFGDVRMLSVSLTQQLRMLSVSVPAWFLPVSEETEMHETRSLL